MNLLNQQQWYEDIREICGQKGLKLYSSSRYKPGRMAAKGIERQYGIDEK